MNQGSIRSLFVILIISLFIMASVCFDKSTVVADPADSWAMYRHDLQRSGFSTSSAPNTNATRWIYNASYEFDSSPSIANGRLIIGESNGDVIAINVTTGNLIWTFETEAGQNSMWSTPAIDSGKVYIGARDGIFYCLNENNGNQLWTYPTGGEINSSPVVMMEGFTLHLIAVSYIV